MFDIDHLKEMVIRDICEWHNKCLTLISMTPKISLIHPTHGRAQQAAATAMKWIMSAGAPKDDIEYIISVDNRQEADAFLNEATQLVKNGDFLRNIKESNYPVPLKSLFVICINDNKSAIEAVNNAAKIATNDIFIQIADDFDCFKYWDIYLLAALEDKSDFLVKTQDGLQPFLITLPIMDRAYYNRFDYIYNPDYIHLWSDTEMTAVGHMLDRVITLPLIFPHNHYTTGKSPKDAISIKNDSTWTQGETLYNQRKAINFGLTKEQIVKPFPAQFL